MKKIVFYIPVILFTVLYGGIAITFGIGRISPTVFAWISLFLTSGFLLRKGKPWGGILGMFPGINLIYMSTKYTGQVVDIEFSMGIIILIFYLFCSGFVLYKKLY